MKIKTADLIGWQLDYMVNQLEKAGAERQTVTSVAHGRTFQMRFNQHWRSGHEIWDVYSPSTNWAQGGLIIEREFINLSGFKGGAHWSAERRCGDNPKFFKGPTPLIAAMRCFVASKLGDEVEVPA